MRNVLNPEAASIKTLLQVIHYRPLASERTAKSPNRQARKRARRAIKQATRQKVRLEIQEELHAMTLPQTTPAEDVAYLEELHDLEAAFGWMDFDTRTEDDLHTHFDELQGIDPDHDEHMATLFDDLLERESRRDLLTTPGFHRTKVSQTGNLYR